MRAYWLALTLGYFAWANTALAQPIVRVRAETRLEVASEVAGDAVIVRGALRDDAGAPLSNRTISLTLRGEEGLEYLRLDTDASGEFATRLSVSVTSVELRFDAEEFLMSTATTLQIDARRAHVTLHVETPSGGMFSLDEPEHMLRITAESEHGGGGLHLTLSHELGQLIAAGTTDSDAQWVIRLQSSELGSAGVGRLVVRSTADERRSVAQTEVPIVRSRNTQLGLTHASLVTGGLRVQGSLRTAERSLERRAISVLVNDELAGTALTDMDGRLDLVVPPDGLPTNTYDVALRFDSDAPWLLSSTSNTIAIQRSARQWLLPALAIVSVLAVMLLARWRTIRPTSLSGTDAETAEAGVVLQKPTRWAELTTIEVMVVRAGTATGLSSVVVRLADQATATTDDRGLFSTTLAPGTHELTFDVAGYEPLTHRVTVPHRGEWSGATVRLRNRRDLANDVMLDAFAPRIPREDWGAATNRELFAKARERGAGSDELLALVDSVEALVYAGNPPGADDLARIRELARLTRPHTR